MTCARTASPYEEAVARRSSSTGSASRAAHASARSTALLVRTPTTLADELTPYEHAGAMPTLSMLPAPDAPLTCDLGGSGAGWPATAPVAAVALPLLAHTVTRSRSRCAASRQLAGRASKRVAPRMTSKAAAAERASKSTSDAKKGSGGSRPAARASISASSAVLLPNTVEISRMTSAADAASEPAIRTAVNVVAPPSEPGGGGGSPGARAPPGAGGTKPDAASAAVIWSTAVRSSSAERGMPSAANRRCASARHGSTVAVPIAAATAAVTADVTPPGPGGAGASAVAEGGTAAACAAASATAPVTACATRLPSWATPGARCTAVRAAAPLTTRGMVVLSRESRMGWREASTSAAAARTARRPGPSAGSASAADAARATVSALIDASSLGAMAWMNAAESLQLARATPMMPSDATRNARAAPVPSS